MPFFISDSFIIHHSCIIDRSRWRVVCSAVFMLGSGCCAVSMLGDWIAVLCLCYGVGWSAVSMLGDRIAILCLC